MSTFRVSGAGLTLAQGQDQGHTAEEAGPGHQNIHQGEDHHHPRGHPTPVTQDPKADHHITAKAAHPEQEARKPLSRTDEQQLIVKYFKKEES